MATKWRDLLQKEFGYSLSFSVNTLLAWIILPVWWQFYKLVSPSFTFKIQAKQQGAFYAPLENMGKKGATLSLSLSLQSFVIAVGLIDSWYGWVRALPVHPPISHLLQALNMMAEGRRSVSCSQWVTLDEDADGEMQFLSSIICLSPCFSAWGPSTHLTADHPSACPQPPLIKAARGAAP